MRDPWGNEFCVLQTGFPELLARREPWTDEQAASAPTLLFLSSRSAGLARST
jgi:hypothetical protein